MLPPRRHSVILQIFCLSLKIPSAKSLTPLVPFKRKFAYAYFCFFIQINVLISNFDELPR